MEAMCSSETSVETQRTTRLACCFLLNLFLPPWRWRRCVPPKRRLKLNGLHGIISQKMTLFNFFPILRNQTRALRSSLSKALISFQTTRTSTRGTSGHCHRAFKTETYSFLPYVLNVMSLTAPTLPFLSLSLSFMNKDEHISQKRPWNILRNSLHVLCLQLIFSVFSNT
jgi:hypothetical protein